MNPNFVTQDQINKTMAKLKEKILNQQHKVLKKFKATMYEWVRNEIKRTLRDF